MGSIDYGELRRIITIREVLDLIHWEPVSRHGSQLRGPCPVHRSKTQGSRVFSVNLTRHIFRCFKRGCNAQGNALDLYQAVSGLPFYQAAIDLCQRLGVEVPRLRR